MIFLAIALAALLVYLLQSRLFTRHAFDFLRYRVRFSSDEVFEGETIFLYEELENGKSLPLPNARVEAELPDGISFCLHEKQGKNRGKEKRSASASSVFALHGGETVSRRWRVFCGKRGVYTPKGALIIAGDLFGTDVNSRRVELTPDRENTVTVLPRTIPLQSLFAFTDETDGETTVPHGLLTDSTRICGVREYAAGDPMNRINWKSSAVHGELMVNLEEYSEKECFNIVLNMQSRPVEHTPGEPGDPDTVELCITVAASVLDGLAEKRQPVRLLINAPSAGLDAHLDPAFGTGNPEFLITREYRGREDTLDTLRLLAALPLAYSCRAEEMEDRIASDPGRFARGNNLVFITSFLDERMLVFHEIMRRAGVHVSFYVTGGNRNAVAIPPDVPVAFRTHRGEALS